MRTVHRNAPIIVGAGVLALLLVAPASLSLFAEEPAYTGSVVIDAENDAALARHQFGSFGH